MVPRSFSGVITVGVDLAAEAAGTAVATISWQAGTATITRIGTAADDEAIVAAAKDAQKVGIDCPLGWPDSFVDFVTAHRAGTRLRVDAAEPAWRRSLVNRVTDLACIAYTEKQTGHAIRPLSVAADLLGHVGLRCAVLLSRIAAAGIPVDRSGVYGRVVEVYPAASIALWELDAKRYKGTSGRVRLGAAIDDLKARASWLQWDEAAEATCRRSDHAFDAVLAALAARAAAIEGGVTVPETDVEVRHATTEGWIALPTVTLDALVG